jgi:hypothetical protein
MKVIHVRKKQGRKDTYWATIEYTKEELEKEFPSIAYGTVDDAYLGKFDEMVKISKSLSKPAAYTTTNV